MMKHGWTGLALVLLAGCSGALARSSSPDEAFTKLAEARGKVLAVDSQLCQANNPAACDRVCVALGPAKACETACQQNQPASCHELGLDAKYGLVRPGNGTRTVAVAPDDVKVATAMFEKACGLGFAASCSEGGGMLVGTSGMFPEAHDAPRGLALLEAGCRLEKDYVGVADARWRSCFDLAILHLDLGHAAAAKATQTRACALAPGACNLIEANLPVSRGFTGAKAVPATGEGARYRRDQLNQEAARYLGDMERLNKGAVPVDDVRAMFALAHRGIDRMILGDSVILHGNADIVPKYRIAYDQLERLARDPAAGAVTFELVLGQYKEAKGRVLYVVADHYGTEVL
jgi:hypothetical protein